MSRLAHSAGRLSVPEIGKAMRDISRAWRRSGLDSRWLHDFRHRFGVHGLQGVVSQSAQPGPGAASLGGEAALLAASLCHPAWGCARLCAALRQEGVALQPSAARQLLREQGLATRRDRWLRLEAEVHAGAVTPSDEQLRFLVEQNPCWRERAGPPPVPGALLCQQTVCVARCRRECNYLLCRLDDGRYFYLGEADGADRIWLHLVVDAGSMLGFALVQAGRCPEAAVALLHNDVLPFFGAEEIPVSAVLTGGGRELCGGEAHPYELYLALSGIEHRRRPPRCRTGFMERFRRALVGEFFRSVTHRTFYNSLEPLQRDLDAWLTFYNTQREHPGYPNGGRTPIDVVQSARARQQTKETRSQPGG